jgi:uncharacterized membrane protein
MAELIVIGYDTAEKADAARTELFGLSKEYLVEVGDAVIATRDADGKIKLNQMLNLWAVGAAGGSLWGLLAGFLFFNPLLGAVGGAAAGAVAAALNDYGIGDDFMRDVAGVLRPGQAALFILATRVSSERVIERLARHGGKVLRTNLDRSQEDRLRAAFGQAAAAPETQAMASPEAQADAAGSPSDETGPLPS